MGFPNPNNLPQGGTIHNYVAKGQLWLEQAQDNYDPEFPDPSIAMLARMRSMLMAAVKAIDEIIHDDAIDVCIDMHTVEQDRTVVDDSEAMRKEMGITDKDLAEYMGGEA